MTENVSETVTENVSENVTEDENVTSDLAEEVVGAVHKSQQLTIEAVHKGQQLTLETAKKSQQLTIETAKKIAEALSTAASTAAAKLPGRQLAHRLPARPFAEGLPTLPKLPEKDAVLAAARDYAGRLFAEQRRFAMRRVVAEQRRFGRHELVLGAVSGARHAACGRPTRPAEADEAAADRGVIHHDRESPQCAAAPDPAGVRRRRAL